MNFRKINVYEREGLKKILRGALGISIENIICGTREDGAINIQNTYAEFNPNGDYQFLGAVGISESNDIIFEYWDKTQEVCKSYWMSESDSRSRIPQLKEVHANIS